MGSSGCGGSGGTGGGQAPLPFADRPAGGRELAARIAALVEDHRVVVLGLPRGGVPVAYEVANALGCPLDVFVVRKLGVPGHEELALGAVASGGAVAMNEGVVRRYGPGREVLDSIVARGLAEIRAAEARYREGREPLPVAGRTVVLVDDGLATGATMRAAVAAVRSLDPRWVVAAAPVGSAQACDDLRSLADDVVCAATPDPFIAVGAWYRDFEPVSDADVRRFLGEPPSGQIYQ
ncbi:MAG TPA: phosphoribosyltransferase [Candidatus Dormibacteraeota bacterium]|nr:phosphoribosyltransferase [Candidatus Dormibacteraeota bacterium]